MILRRAVRGLLFFLLPSILFAAGADAGVLRVERARERTAPEAARAPRLRHFPDVIGEGPLRPLLPGSGRTYADLLKSPEAAPSTTIRVAVFRIEFENDSAGEATTGDGRFILEDDGSWFIDAPPHDSLYFHTHLTVLRRYYEAQSYGNLRIEWEIFPKSLAAGEYRLHDTADYLPAGSPDSWTIDDRVDGLIRLCKDALALVDTVDPGVVFSAYDGYMIIHAGPDLQTDINGDSPGDTPSFFLSFGDEDSVVVDRDSPDSVLVRGVTMIPEYNSQDGFSFGLNGVIAHEFGHQLGLPDLYNTERSWPAIGVWGLMDSGGMIAIDAGGVYLGSVIPASLCAWSKLYLGWATPEIVTTSRDLRIACATLADPPEGAPRYALIPLNDREYFLIENRCGLAPLGEYAAKLDTLNQVVLGPVTNDSLELFTGDYDYALPGWGLLIWHINNRKLTEEAILYTNDVNNDYNNRAVELEEADGIKDLGNPYSAYWDGSPYDPFFEGNATVFGPGTAPNSNLTDGGRSRVTVRGIGAWGAVMELAVDVDRNLAGWPIPLLIDSSAAAPEGIALARSDGAVHVAAFWTAGDSTEARSGVTVAAAEETLRIARAELPGPLAGNALVGDLVEEIPGEELYAIAGGRVLRIDLSEGALVRDLGEAPSGEVSGGPLLLDIDGGGVSEIVVAAGESLFVYAVFSDSIARLRSDPLPGLPSSNLAASSDGGGGPRVYFLSQGSLYGLAYGEKTRAGSVRARGAFGASEGSVLLADLDRDGAREIVVVTNSGAAYAVSEEGRDLPGWPVFLGKEPTGTPFACDRDEDGFPEIAIPVGPDLVLLEKNGIRQMDTPLRIPPYLQKERILAGNGVAALREGGRPLPPIAADDGGRLWMWEGRERVSPGWPFSTGTANLAVRGGPAPGGSGAALYALSRDGFLYGYPFEGAEANRFLWWGPGGSPGASYALADSLLAPPAPPGAPPGRIVRAFCYPNPVRGDRALFRYELTAEANVTIAVHDSSGKRVARIERAPGAPGENEVALDAGALSSGVYTVRIDSGAEHEFVRMAIIR